MNIITVLAHLRARVLGAAVAVTTIALAPALAGAWPMAHADEVTVSQDGLRTGWDSSEPALTHATVSGGSFGELFSTAVTGQVYGQPLVVGLTVIVATENDWVYGLDAATGAVNWSVSLGTPWAIGTICGDLTPDIGVTGAPVYDSATGAVYLVAATVVNSSPAYDLYGSTRRPEPLRQRCPSPAAPATTRLLRSTPRSSRSGPASC